MKIAVCDDNAADRGKLCALIKMYCGRRSLDAEVQEFESGAELLNRMGQTAFSVVFLEIFIGEENGLKLARVIRQRYGGCMLFFYTSSRKYALESYEIGALHYLVKPVDYARVEDAIDRCGDRLLSLARTLLVSVKPERRVLLRDIMFVEIYDKNCHIHTNGEVLTMRRTIRKLEEELRKASFLRCHRSFIVNMEHVREYDQTDFIMNNGERVPIRQAGRSRVKQVFRDYKSVENGQLIFAIDN